jgi:hypothetical protein
MASNPFDQFDTVSTEPTVNIVATRLAPDAQAQPQGPIQVGNPFDQFDNPNTQAAVNMVAPQFSPIGTPLENFEAGAGKAIVDLGRGLEQRLGIDSQANLSSLITGQDSVTQQRKIDAPLMNTTSGQAGNIAGNIAAAIPAAFIPGANTLAGTAAISAALGAMAPTGPGESAVKNAAESAVEAPLAMAGLRGAGSLASKALSNQTVNLATQAAENAPRDMTIQNAQALGYAMPPSMGGGGLIGHTGEALSGKFKLEELLTARNQAITDAAARADLGLPPGTPLTAAITKGVRDNAYNTGYAPIAQLPMMQTGQDFHNALSQLEQRYQTTSFPNAVNPDVANLINQYRASSYMPGDAIQHIQNLRNAASDSFRNGNTPLAQTQRGIANALENDIEQNLALQVQHQVPPGPAAHPGVLPGQPGPQTYNASPTLNMQTGQAAQLLQNFRNARTLMAKSHDWEDAIQQGSGHVNAHVMGDKAQAGVPLSGAAKVVGDFASQKDFRKVTGLPKAENPNPFTWLDAAVAEVLTSGGLLEHHIGAVAAGLGLPLSRAAGRYGIASPWYQSHFMGPPSYQPNSALSGANAVLNQPRIQAGIGPALANVLRNYQGANNAP